MRLCTTSSPLSNRLPLSAKLLRSRFFQTDGPYLVHLTTLSYACAMRTVDLSRRLQVTREVVQGFNFPSSFFSSLKKADFHCCTVKMVKMMEK
jgi:hypothetical protein